MKRKVVVLLAVCLTMWMQSSPAQATTANGQSSVGVSFVEEEALPNTGGDEDIVTTTPNQTTSTTKPRVRVARTTSSGNRLPQTSEVMEQGISLIGLCLLIVVLFTCWLRRRGKHEKA